VIARRRQPLEEMTNTALTGATYDVDGGRQFAA
jgi:hypothetical protein